MELTVRDTILYVPARRGPLPFMVCHPITRYQPTKRRDGKVTTYKITPKEMEKLWK